MALPFGHPEQAFYVRQIVRFCGKGVRTVQREFGQLTAAGILRRTVRGRQVFLIGNECERAGPACLRVLPVTAARSPFAQHPTEGLCRRLAGL